jgi:HlyD family secretion protein
MKRWFWRAIAVLVVGALAATIALGIRPKPIAVDVAVARVAPLEQLIVHDGRARIQERYTVSAPVAGTLARIELREGDSVEPGAVVARLLPLPAPLLDQRARDVAGHHVAATEDAHRQAQASLERAEQAAANAQRDLDRVQALFGRQATTQVDLDSAAAELRVRKSEVQAARFAARVAAHGIDEARAALETFSGHDRAVAELQVTSPVRGRVLHVLQKSEGVVAAGTALFEVGDPQALELVVDVLSQDAVQAKPGMAARVVHWGGEPSLRATVRRVEPAAFTRTSALGVDEQRVNVLLDLDSPPEQWRTLGDGFAIEVEITTWSKPDALQVPASGLFRQDGGWAVFVLDHGVAVVRRVDVGHRGAIDTEIVSGLVAGDQVIVHPGAAVRAGASVAARRGP